MNSSHPRMTIRSLGPIGVVTGPGGPVGIGIGLPIMSTMPHSQMVPQLGQYHPQKKLVSPDSSDGNDKIVAQLFAHHRSPPTVSSLQSSAGVTHSPMTWSNPLLPSSMSYPVMGMGVGVMGPTHGLSDASVLYGLISPAAAAQNMNIPNSTMNHQNQVLGLSPMTSNVISSSEQVGSSEASFSGRDRIISPPQTAEPQPAKEIIHCKHVTLFPPNPSTPAPTTREKPPGCRTVFVGGLPEYVTEELVRELFDRCGEIAKIRMSKKNFCHIRFELEQCIEAAIDLSGYRIRIGSNSDSPNIGRLHVDYAQARDDLYEFECRQRQHLREQRHKERIVKERLMPASPPNIAVYSDHEASLVAEKIKSDDSFIKGIHVLAAWLERGDCLKKNSTSFYSMIQSTNQKR
ncbi:Ecto-NOX disulfide-thiol exchanger 1 [Folsomia candida]|uniref:Ecto-NOX disulfide-thiol exchanger 1 n=2 Tax=Folsomia candida TaxID=158441 RepID=A0A226F4N3_FOLCA|nr:Ecto-NOX disulfide-thiol exchanger 1 [Folsomia candida]